ncbi:MAG: GNAT family N-acetyltransferase [Gammaproteobacteria bacterium]|nr:MAG: GNAT family N-acetyltransferase [Gammaproteobacteria bacterium]
MAVDWQFFTFAELDAATVYGFLKLRQDVFVLEQKCLYPDIDGLDLSCWHLVGKKEGAVIGYLRIIPPEHHPKAVPAIGRVVVAPAHRGQGLATQMMRHAIRHCAQHYPGQDLFLSAQTYLVTFYQSLGFVSVGAPYLEDGIEHIDMFKRESA